MLMFILRAVFLLALAAVGMRFAAEPATGPGLLGGDLMLGACMALALLVIAFDIFIPQKSLTSMSGLFFGLMVGMVGAYGLSLIVDLMVEAILPGWIEPPPPAWIIGQDGIPIPTEPQEPSREQHLLSVIKVGLGVVCCYLAVSFILQTKDDIRFVIPYVEFTKQTRGGKPLLLDTSVIIDGRIADIAETHIIESEMVVPRFILQELQAIADSSDKLKRNRGRRGLDMLNKMRLSENTLIKILDVERSRGEKDRTVDEMLLETALALNGRVVTNDYNLNKLAQLRGVGVININDLANALKPVFLPGESMTVKIIKAGEEMGQGVGYLEDGTMVVVDGGRNRIGATIDVSVTSVLQTSAGRMIFGRTGDVPDDRRRHRAPPDSGGPRR
ncbi:MAG: PIN domain-containing protein [Planctomycetes bacterium]|nr:PIN domain-containing protein [Planctomycetota bacterium]